jgi:hypothetical protein
MVLPKSAEFHVLASMKKKGMGRYYMFGLESL